MFYSEQVLAKKKGALARIWIAAHFERKLSKAQLIQTNIESSVDAIKGETEESAMALRRSGQLLLGVVRIYSKKTKYLLEDCNEALLRIKISFRPGQVNLPDGQLVASFNAITIGESLTEFDMLLPEPVLDLKALMQAQRSSLSQSSSSFSSSQVPSTPSQRTRRRDLMMLPPQSPNALSSLMQNDPFDDPLDLIQLKSQRQDRYDPVQTDEGSMTPMDVEVGRDAIPESQQLDFRRESFLNGDDELSTASKRQPELPMGAENITFEAPFPFSDGPDLGDMHMDHNDDTFQMGDNDVASLALEHPDLPLTLSFEMPSRAGSVPQSPARSVFADPFSALNRSGSSTSRTPSTVKEAPRKKPVQKRKELELDSVIELDAGAMSRQMRETADISKKPKLLPLTREMEEWEKMTAKDLLGLGAFGRMPARFAHLLKIHESAPMAPIPRRASAIRPFEPADDNPVIQESQDLLEDIHFDDQQGTGLDFNDPQDYFDNQEEPSFDVDPFANAHSFNDDLLQENIDPQSPMQSNLSFAKAFKDAEAPLLPLTPRRLNNQTAVFPSPMIGGPLRSSVPPESINGDVRESSVFENGTREKNNAPRTQNPATSIAISILKNELAECGESAHFMDLASKMNKKDTVKFFFETLVLKTRNLIEVQQEKSFGSIQITSKPELYQTVSQ